MEKKTFTNEQQKCQGCDELSKEFYIHFGNNLKEELIELIHKYIWKTDLQKTVTVNLLFKKAYPGLRKNW